MQVKIIAECSKGCFEIILTLMKLPVVIKIVVLSIFGWLFYTGFTVYNHMHMYMYVNSAWYRWLHKKLHT